MAMKNQCDGTYKIIDGFEFCYYPGKITFNEAKIICERKGLQLVDAMEKEKANVISKFCTSEDCTWLSLSCSSKNRRL